MSDVGAEVQIKKFMQEAVDNACEGLMVKSLDEDSAYRPDKRDWYKVCVCNMSYSVVYACLICSEFFWLLFLFAS